MKYYSTSSLFSYTWGQVAEGLWHRYPNPYSKHVLTEDVVERKVVNKKLYSKRLLTKTNSIPKWGERLLRGPKYVTILEESIVDPVRKHVTTYTRNIGMKSIMVVAEKCVYRMSSENRSETLCEREAWIGSSVFGLAKAIQMFGMERFKKNAVKASKGLEYALDKIHMKSPAPEALMIREKIQQATAKAKDIAKAKARPVVAQCSAKETS